MLMMNFTGVILSGIILNVLFTKMLFKSENFVQMNYFERQRNIAKIDLIRISNSNFIIL